MAELTREQVLSADDLKRDTVEVPEWAPPGSDPDDPPFVRIRSMTGTERGAFEQQSYEQRGRDVRANLANVRERLIVIACINEDDTPKFRRTDVVALGKKNAKPLDRIFERACKLSGIGQEQLEEMTKNSESSQSDDSGSSLPTDGDAASENASDE